MRLCKGATAGTLGGLAGSWTMNLFQTLLGKISAKKSEPDQQTEQDESPGDNRPARSQSQGNEPATAVLAEKVSERVLHHRLTEEEKKIAEPAVHYGYGMLVGALYGALAEEMPVATACYGTLYSSALWLLGDEMAVPMLKLSKPPTQYPPKTHLSAFASHLVYGLTAESVRRMVRAAL